MITQPLGLEARLSPRPRDMDGFFWVNAGAIVLFFTLLGSRFVLATGEPVQLGGIRLPALDSAVERTASVVVSYKRDNMVLFEGGIFELRELRAPLEAYATKHPGAVMLVRVDKQVSVQGLLEVFDLAKSAGFAQVLLAAEPQSADQPGLVSPVP
jgi:biopolymer transport protein ExbD